jgi:hypothetical protein
MPSLFNIIAWEKIQFCSLGIWVGLWLGNPSCVEFSIEPPSWRRNELKKISAWIDLFLRLAALYDAL